MAMGCVVVDQQVWGAGRQAGAGQLPTGRERKNGFLDLFRAQIVSPRPREGLWVECPMRVDGQKV